MTKNTYVLITGSSAGIGLELAHQFASKGYNIVLTARREERLIKLSDDLMQQYGVDAKFISADLADVDAPKKIYDFCKNSNLDIEILVNNAGYSINKKFQDTSEEIEDKFLTVLGTSIVHLTKYFINDFLSRGGGRIMMVSSLASFAPPSSGWGMMYGPVKTFINRFGDAININYNSKGITSTNVCPGFTVTEFHTASGMQDKMDAVPSFMKKDVKYVAKGAVAATLKGKQVWVPGTLNKLLAFLCNALPAKILIKLSARLAGGRYD
ncbi:MAG: hypothetical protein RI886_132 [Pseudomonadota bacterium]|jgi:short-subunit dehydrogenase